MGIWLVLYLPLRKMMEFDIPSIWKVIRTVPGKKKSMRQV